MFYASVLTLGLCGASVWDVMSCSRVPVWQSLRNAWNVVSFMCSVCAPWCVFGLFLSCLFRGVFNLIYLFYVLTASPSLLFFWPLAWLILSLCFVLTVWACFMFIVISLYLKLPQQTFWPAWSAQIWIWWPCFNNNNNNKEIIHTMRIILTYKKNRWNIFLALHRGLEYPIAFFSKYKVQNYSHFYLRQTSIHFIWISCDRPRQGNGATAKPNLTWPST